MFARVSYTQQFAGSGKPLAEPHGPVGNIQDLRTGGHWFDPQLSQYSLGGLVIVIGTYFIPLSPHGCPLF